MENTLENRSIFFNQYHRQNLLSNKGKCCLRDADFIDELEWIELKPLSLITDEELMEVFRLAHNMKSVKNCQIERLNDIIHCKLTQKDISAEYHICLNYKYATINCNLFFNKNEHSDFSKHKVNIGEIHFSSKRVVGYIQTIDYLRSKGYALPYRDLSIDNIIKFGWIRIKQAP